MKILKSIPWDFPGTYDRIKENSLLFENSSITHDVMEGDNNENRLNIKIWENKFLDEYLPDIISTANVASFEEPGSSDIYYMNPKRLSFDLFGVSDYWWLILAINNYTSIHDFKDFKTLLIPNDKAVAALIVDYENNK